MWGRKITLPSKYLISIGKLHDYGGAVRRMRTRLCLAKAAVLLSCKKTTPLDQSSGAGLLKMSAVYVATILIEVVKDGSVNGGKFLQTSHLPEPLHRPLLSSEGLV
jgi:hypothetical protein